MSVFEIIGWFGVLLFISAYLLLSFNKLKPNKMPYQLMNILGAICLMLNSYYFNDFPNFILNLIWMCIGIVAIMCMFKTKVK